MGGSRPSTPLTTSSGNAPSERRAHRGRPSWFARPAKRIMRNPGSIVVCAALRLSAETPHRVPLIGRAKPGLIPTNSAWMTERKSDKIKWPCLWLAAPLDKYWMLQPCGGNLLNLGMTAGLDTHRASINGNSEKAAHRKFGDYGS
jgi:hypothetical protein